MTKTSAPKEQGKASAEIFDRPRFHPGALYITPGVRDALPPEEVACALARHISGDWGELCREDWEQNELALANGEGRLFSLYRTAQTGSSFYVITEADRSCTTLLLPSEY